MIMIMTICYYFFKININHIFNVSILLTLIATIIATATVTATATATVTAIATVTAAANILRHYCDCSLPFVVSPMLDLTCPVNKQKILHQY